MQQTNDIDLQRIAASFVLKVKEENKLTQVGILVELAF